MELPRNWASYDSSVTKGAYQDPQAHDRFSSWVENQITRKNLKNSITNGIMSHGICASDWNG